MKPTAKQVAHAAGVSLSAVSRALTPGASIEADKKRRVLKAAAELGYTNPARRTAAALSAGTVTLVAGDLLNPFYPMVLDRLAQQLQTTGQRLLVHALPGRSDVDSAIPRILAARPKAIIATSVRLSSEMVDACYQQGIHVVLLNRIQRDARADAVTCDNYAGGHYVARYLLSKGRRRIGFIGGITDTSTHDERARGFRDALGESGHSIFREARGNFDYQVAFQAAEDLLARDPRPDALFCCNDIMALAAIDAARMLGLSVPDDVAVAGFDDIPMANFNSYRLTTVRQPVARMVDEAIRLISAAGDGPRGERITCELPGRLIVRSSA